MQPLRASPVMPRYPSLSNPRGAASFGEAWRLLDNACTSNRLIHEMQRATTFYTFSFLSACLQIPHWKVKLKIDSLQPIACVISHQAAPPASGSNCYTHWECSVLCIDALVGTGNLQKDRWQTKHQWKSLRCQHASNDEQKLLCNRNDSAKES